MKKIHAGLAGLAILALSGCAWTDTQTASSGAATPTATVTEAAPGPTVTATATATATETTEVEVEDTARLDSCIQALDLAQLALTYSAEALDHSQTAVNAAAVQDIYGLQNATAGLEETGENLSSITDPFLEANDACRQG